MQNCCHGSCENVQSCPWGAGKPALGLSKASKSLTIQNRLGLLGTSRKTSHTCPHRRHFLCGHTVKGGRERRQPEPSFPPRLPDVTWLGMQKNKLLVFVNYGKVSKQTGTVGCVSMLGHSSMQSMQHQQLGVFMQETHPFHASISVRGKSFTVRGGTKLSSFPRVNQLYLNKHICSLKILGKKTTKIKPNSSLHT